MEKSLRVCAIIPAYNEAETIADVVREVSSYCDRVIVVDDHSRDETAQIARQNGAHVISCERNLGYDQAIGRGMAEANQSGYDVFFTFDADRQHVGKSITEILKPIKEGSADLVAGIRPQRARLAEQLYRVYAKRKIGLKDPLCGLKAYTAKVYSAAGYFDRLQSIGTELAFRSVLKGFRLAQVPIEIRPRKDESRFGCRLRGNIKIFKGLFRVMREFGL